MGCNCGGSEKSKRPDPRTSTTTKAGQGNSQPTPAAPPSQPVGGNQ